MQAKRRAARKAAKLQWMADQYRRHAEQGGCLEEKAEHIASVLEDMAASVLCRSAGRVLTPLDEI